MWRAGDEIYTAAVRYDGPSIVLFYGLYDNDNKDFIDWEAGESHLYEEPFRELSEFAREYADPYLFYMTQTRTYGRRWRFWTTEYSFFWMQGSKPGRKRSPEITCEAVCWCRVPSILNPLIIPYSVGRQPKQGQTLPTALLKSMRTRNKSLDSPGNCRKFWRESRDNILKASSRRIY